MIDTSFLLRPRVTDRDAATIAQQVTDSKVYADELSLHRYRLLGFRFRIQNARGPMRKLEGSEICAVVDPATGTAMTADPWEIESSERPRPRGGDVSQEEVHACENAAQKAVYVSLVKHYRLASSFELVAKGAPHELWKPNWLFENDEIRILIDGLNGEFAVRRRSRERTFSA